jgi:TonB family protein
LIIAYILIAATAMAQANPEQKQSGNGRLVRCWDGSTRGEFEYCPFAPPRTNSRNRVIEPVPIGGRGNWISAKDYPPMALHNKWIGTTGVAMTMNAVGRVESCEIVRTSGYAALDDRTCQLLQARATYKPAMAADGVTPIRIIKTSVVWEMLNAADRKSHPAAFQILLYPQAGSLQRGALKHPEPINFDQWNQMLDWPAASKTKAIEYRISVGSDGKAADCSISASSGDAEFDSAVCKGLIRDATFVPATDEQAVPIAGEFSWQFTKTKVAKKVK